MSASPPYSSGTTVGLRALTALAVLVSGLCHGYLYFFGGWDFGRIGVLFMINAVSGIVISVLVLAWRHWFSLFLAFGFSVVTAAGFLFSRYGGELAHKVLGVNDMVWGWSQILCLVAEVVGAIAALCTFFSERWLTALKGRHPAVA